MYAQAKGLRVDGLEQGLPDEFFDVEMVMMVGLSGWIERFLYVVTDLEEKIGIAENVEVGPECGKDCVGVGSKERQMEGQRLNG